MYFAPCVDDTRATASQCPAVFAPRRRLTRQQGLQPLIFFEPSQMTVLFLGFSSTLHLYSRFRSFV